MTDARTTDRRTGRRKVATIKEGWNEEPIFPNFGPRLEVSTIYSVYSKNKHRNKRTNFVGYMGMDGEQESKVVELGKHKIRVIIFRNR